MTKEKDKLRETQPIEPPTAADVLEVFGHFERGLLEKIDERDANVLTLIQKTVSDLLADNYKLHERADDHNKRINQNARDIEELRKKQNEFASELQALKIKLRER